MSRLAIAFAWACVAVWAKVIWDLGSGDFSDSHTSSFVVPFVQWLWPDVSHRDLWRIRFALRKSAHLFEYSVLAALAYRAMRVSVRSRRLAAAGVALVLVLGLAAADEGRQRLLPNRTGSPIDVAIDLTGGALAIAAIIGFGRYRQRHAAAPTA